MVSKAMNIDFDLITNILDLCNKHYKPETLQHCLRVANYAKDNACLKYDEDKRNAYLIGLLHDLLEDTSVTIDEIQVETGWSSGYFMGALDALTKDNSETYIEYIGRLKESGNYIAYIVKLADMKDHLIQKETLTDKLKEKYWNALPELL